MKATFVLVVVPILVVSVLIIGAFNGFKLGDDAKLPSSVSSILTHPGVQMQVERSPGRLTIEVSSDDKQLAKQLQAAGLELEALRMQLKKTP